MDSIILLILVGAPRGGLPTYRVHTRSCAYTRNARPNYCAQLANKSFRKTESHSCRLLFYYFFMKNLSVRAFFADKTAWNLCGIIFDVVNRLTTPKCESPAVDWNHCKRVYLCCKCTWNLASSIRKEYHQVSRRVHVRFLFSMSRCVPCLFIDKKRKRREYGRSMYVCMYVCMLSLIHI